MSLMAVGSARGAPGATTLALALGGMAHNGRTALVEVDPSGGVLAARLGLRGKPGLISLATAGRGGLSDELIWEHTQAAGETELMVAPPAAHQVRGALEALGGRLGAQLASMATGDVVVDCGRLDASSPALSLAQAADLVLLVARPVAWELASLGTLVPDLATRGCRLALALVGEASPYRPELYPPSEVGGVLGVDVVGVLADDARGAAALWRGQERALRRSALMRSCLSLAAAVSARAGAPTARAAPPAASLVATAGRRP